MKFFISSLTVVILFSSWANNLFIVTKLDISSFINYYQKERMEHNVENIKELFSKKDLFQYCEQLREAIVFEVVTTSEEFLENPSVLHLNFSKQSLEAERDDTQMKLFNLRLGISKHTVAFWGFQCMNYKKNMSWIVSPAFVPDSAVLNSAFLFDFELNFRKLSQRGIRGGTEVIARSVAFLDQSGRTYNQSVLETFFKFTENINERDPICDLNVVLKLRLCSVTYNSMNASYPFGNPLVEIFAYRDYTVVGLRQYFNAENTDDGCESIEMSPLIDNSLFAYRKMWPCPVNKPHDAPSGRLHIGLDPLSSRRIFCHYLGENVQGEKRQFIWTVEIPLLSHLNLSDYNG